jgi:integrase
MRVLTAEEDYAYLKAASDTAHGIHQAYEEALQVVRAVVRGEQPIKPDAFLLRDVATILIDGGFRPEECYRLKWENVRDAGINVDHGKGRGSRRRVPALSAYAASLRCALLRQQRNGCFRPKRKADTSKVRR